MNSRPDDTLAQLTAAGVAVWLDDISRERLSTGNLETLMRDLHVRGVTSNPTIFAKAISSGSGYEDQIADLALRGVSVGEASRAITTYDIRWACDVLRPVYDETNGVDGRVSLEVDPRIANDTTGKTFAEAKALWWMVDRPNLFIKIPATEAGLPAITQSLAEGISVNVTLIFSLQRYGQVIDAFMAGLEAAAAAGRDLSKIASVASFFVSRVDTEVDERLDKIGTPEAEALRGKAALANARLAYELYEQRFATSRWSALSARGGDAARDPGPRHAARRHDPRNVRRVPEGLRAARGPGHRLRRRGDGAGAAGRAEVRGIVERAARDDQDRDGRRPLGRRVSRVSHGGGGTA
jgi:transaldolase